MRVKQVENLLDLFEIYARNKAPLTLTALSKVLGMPKSSTFNLIDTLVVRGFLYETKARGGFYPTRRLLDLARSVMEGDPFLERIHGELEALAKSTGETALLSARDNDHVIYVDVVESPALIRYSAKVGDRRPMHTTSSGKAILTTYPPDERERILRSLTYVAHQTTTKTTSKELAANLEEAIARGWCEDHAETTPDVMGLGVPILDGERRFGLAVAGPLYRMQNRRKELAALLQSAARRIKQIVGPA
ncbi:IclR family transcriptional regulator [Allomesorhizobium camelthorni]|uniref:IclR family transcriptional regulator n=1 Tax=Allomesorhizobium camelthorni TaxID=475069 RepID=A0A6G4WNE1_9HYPH|nr:IclR family transcriptional regulator [Mesorhizobium camelthorni]NGO55620.1 IclR family transcriptional regulator [Mesorhizobium camelthorni]